MLAQERVDKTIVNGGYPAKWEVMSKDFVVKNDSTKSEAILFSALQTIRQNSGALIRTAIAAPVAKKVDIKFKIYISTLGNGISFQVNVQNKNDILQTTSFILNNKDVVFNEWKEYTLKVNNYQAALLQGANLLSLQVTVGGNAKIWVRDIQLITDSNKNYGEKAAPTYEADVTDEFNDGSGINTIKLSDPVLVNNLIVLGKVWGFLKYYHPAVRNGSLNWDYELFKIAPKIIALKNSAERNVVLEKWVTALNEFLHEKRLQSADKLNYGTRLSWLNRIELGDSLFVSLDKLRFFKRDTSSYYLQYDNEALVPAHENSYSNKTYPDAGLRLLTAFRLWNHVNYFYAYKYLLGKKWDYALGKLIVDFLNTRNEHEYFLTFLSTLSSFKNSHITVGGNDHAFSMDNYFWGNNWLNARMVFIKDKAYVEKVLPEVVSRQGNLKLGDEIQSVNGKSVQRSIAKKKRYMSASNNGVMGREYATKLFRTNDSVMDLIVKRNGKRLKIKVTSLLAAENRINALHMTNGIDTPFTILRNKIGYINISRIDDSALESSKSQILTTKALIIDMRRYPKAANWRKFLSDNFFSKKVIFSKYSHTDPLFPGIFKMDCDSVGEKNSSYYSHKVVVLVNEYTQSYAEYLTMLCRQMPHHKILGSETAGADGNLAPLRLPGGLITNFESIGIYTPAGTETQKIGIVPDLKIAPNIKRLTSGEDYLLKKAINICR
ncbi:MAG: S41 family peptidase [Bacteroidota bacterium]|nr:S41 family peptidase [Bacteroidota bacterium]